MQLRSRGIWDRTALFLGTGLGIGMIPVMPGTFGSLLGVGLAIVLSQSVPAWSMRLVLEISIVLIGIPICGRAARLLGRPDPGCVVLDEIAAIPFLFLSVPLNLTTAIIGFVVFRLFDIAKPWPVRRLERFPGGLGIMIDDLAAAAYASAALWLTVRVWPLLGS